MTNFTPLQSAAGGALIGLSAVLLLLFSGRIAGIIGILRRALLPAAGSRPLEAAAFLGGLIAAPLLWPPLTGEAVRQTVSSNLPLVAVAGLLVGFGSVWANGCTSGHGVCGLSRFSIRSLVATLTFMAVAIATVFITRHVLGS
ncbi:MAG: YeeE/YedE family protein [Hyphomicrobium sp.]|nr:YeeE/YedE family protein [Hyphomicrobium sp.]